jgi:hemerythrin
MHKYLCPAAAKNKEAHQKFIRRFKATLEEIKDEKTSDKALKELHCFLEEWIKEHLCKLDVQLKPCVH